MNPPHQHVVLVYGAKIYHAKLVDTSTKLGDKDKTFVQQVTGTFMYYVRAIYATVLLALSAILSDQADPTKDITKKTLEFLDYVTTNPDAILIFGRSSMLLNVHRDTSHLCKHKVKSRV